MTASARTKTILALMALLLWLSDSRLGADMVDRESPMAKSPYKMGQPLWQTGISVDVITSDEIKRRRVETVAELLRGLTGVGVTNIGGPGRMNELRIRGSAPQQTLVMVDGIRIHNNADGYPELSHLTVDNIDRIEIARGQLSAIWGSDAVGGVVHIFTKRGEENLTTISLSGGSQTTGRAALSTSTSNENHRMSLAGSWKGTEGFSAANNRRGNPEKDGDRTRSLNLNYETKIGRAGVGLTLMYLDSASDIDGDGPVDNRSFYQDDRDLGAALTFSRAVGRRWVHTAQFTSFENDERRDTGTPRRVVSTTKAAEWRGYYEHDEKSRLLFGLRSERRGGKYEGQFDRDNTNNSVYAELLHSPQKRLDLGFAARYDRQSLFGGKHSWLATGVYKHSPGLRFRGSYGTGYRTPTSEESFLPRFGNLYLQPEETKGWDLGLEHLLLDRIFVKLGYFHNETEAAIDYITPGNIAGNARGTRADGWEAAGSWTITDQFSVEAGFTHLNTLDKNTQRDLARRPGDSARVGLRYQPSEHVGLDATYDYTGGSFSAPNQQSYVKPFGVLSGVLNYQPVDGHDFWLKLHNLANNDYEEVTGFGAREFSVDGGYEYTFGPTRKVSEDVPVGTVVEADTVRDDEYANVEIDRYHGEAYNDVENLLTAAELESSNGDHRKALELYRRAEGMNPRSFRIKYNLGTVHYLLKEYPEALVKYKEARLIKPDDLQTLLYLGYCYYHRDERGMAIETWKSILQVDPENTQALRNLQMLKARW